MRLHILLASLVLAGCTTTKTVWVPQPCPKPVVPPEPHYPVQDLRPGDKPDKVMKSYVATVKGQHDYIEQLKHILRGYE